MVKLRHILGPNLKELEKTLEGVKNSIQIVGVNAVGSNWYIHFLVQDTWNEQLETKQELGLPTQVVPRIKRGK
jgi:hypothetical protein